MKISYCMNKNMRKKLCFKEDLYVLMTWGTVCDD